MNLIFYRYYYFYNYNLKSLTLKKKKNVWCFYLLCLLIALKIQNKVLLLLFFTSLINQSFGNLYPYSYLPRFPLDIVVGLPTTDDNFLLNPFRLTIAKSQPVFDVAIEDIILRYKLLKKNALQIVYEDTELSDAIGPQKMVDHYCNRSVDAVMGLAYVYALAPVARMSQFWSVGGVPVFTTSAMVDELGNRDHFPLLTRLMGSYATLAAMVAKMVKEYNWRIFHFFFNDQAKHGNSQGRSECYFSLNAIKNVFEHQSDIVWSVEMFSEQTATLKKYTEMLRKASHVANGKVSIIIFFIIY